MKIDAPETSELEVFLAVAEHRSFAQAAKQVGVPRATVSRRLQRLEERLGVRLFRRTTRQVAITRAGEQLEPHARRIVETARAAAQAVQGAQGEVRGLLRVSVPPGQANALDDLLLSFLAAHPGVRMEVERSSRQVDLAQGAFDVALRASSHLDPGLIARKLVEVSLGAWASPEYLDAHGRPTSLEELAEHACLVGYERGVRPATHWPLRSGGHIAVRPRFASNDLGLLAAAARRHHGLVLLPGPFAQGLEPVLADEVGSTSTIALVYADRHTSPVARAFVDHVLARGPFTALPGSGEHDALDL